MVYLDQFYKAVREAIDQKAFADIAYGCYAGCLYSLRVNRPFRETVQHARGFKMGVSFLTPSSYVCEETFFLECLWEKLVWVMTRALVKKTASVESWNIVAELAQPLSLSDYNDQPKWVHEALTASNWSCNSFALWFYLPLMAVRLLSWLKCHSGDGFWAGLNHLLTTAGTMAPTATNSFYTTSHGICGSNYWHYFQTLWSFHLLMYRKSVKTYRSLAPLSITSRAHLFQESSRTWMSCQLFP